MEDEMKNVNLGIRLICPVCFIFFAVLLCCADPACSAYPQPVSGKRVYDFAGLLSSEQKTQLEQGTSEVAEMTTAELDIVTVSSLHGDSIEEYANDLFNEWAIGRTDTNNGVLFLIAPNERRVRIEVGYGLEPLLTDGLCGNIIANNIIPAFKAGRFDEGVISGAERIAGILRQHPERAQGVKDSAPKFLQKAKRVKDIVDEVIGGAERTAGTLKQHPEQAQGIKDSAPKFLRTLKKKAQISNFVHLIPLYIGAFLLIAVLLVRFIKKYPFCLVIVTGPAILFFIFLCYINLKVQFPNGISAKFMPFVVRDGIKGMWFFFGSLFVLFPAIINIARWIRFRPRRCKQCGTQMVLASKKEKDSLLDDGEKKEEKIGSVEYDIWQCRSCNYHKKRKGKTTGQYEECPKCGYRTIEETIVRSATTSSTGLARMKCVYDACRHQYSKTIPRVSRSSSSSGSSSSSSSGSSSSSSSSGGSSGGGGASGGW
ncbi:MAG: hypothetical protein D3917_06185 [Candidatus Electrothrix sp. AX5]|nr:hypothetical protein [Candidatus Electrothrix sp. AX5]